MVPLGRHKGNYLTVRKKVMTKTELDKIKVGSIIRFNYNHGDIFNDKDNHKYNGVVKKINLSEKLYKVFSVCLFLNGQVLEAWVIADNVDCVLKESEDAPRITKEIEKPKPHYEPQLIPKTVNIGDTVFIDLDGEYVSGTVNEVRSKTFVLTYPQIVKKRITLSAIQEGTFKFVKMKRNSYGAMSEET